MRLPRFLPAIRPFALCLALAVPPASADDEEAESFGLLVSAPGAELVYYSCTACHSERIIIQQGLTRADWDELFDWMVEEQGMPEPDSAERAELLDYLAEHYGPDRPNFPLPGRDPPAGCCGSDG